MKRDYALYQVGLKLLLKKGGKVLFLRTDLNFWDLPGGRIDNIEGAIPLEKILKREITEELGPGIKYKIGKPLFQFRRPVPSHGVLNFLTVFEGRYISGQIKLSHEHKDFAWIDPKKYRFRRKDIMSSEEYKALMSHFKK